MSRCRRLSRTDCRSRWAIVATRRSSPRAAGDCLAPADRAGDRSAPRAGGDCPAPAAAVAIRARLALAAIVSHLPIALAIRARILALPAIVARLPAAFAIRARLALPAIISHLPVLAAVPSRAWPIRQRPSDNLVITRPVAVCPAVFTPLVAMLLPVGVPTVAVAIPGPLVITLVIIGVPVGVEFERDHRECDQRSVGRQINELRLVDRFDVVGRDPAPDSGPCDITPGPIGQTAYDRHRVAGGDQVNDRIGYVRPGAQVYVRGGEPRSQPPPELRSKAEKPRLPSMIAPALRCYEDVGQVPEYVSAFLAFLQSVAASEDF